MVPKARISSEAIDVLNIIKMCEKFSIMPNSGGLLDQDKIFVFVLQNVLMWMDQRAELDNQQAASKARAAKG